VPVKLNTADITTAERERLASLIAERSKRKLEGLKLWEPTAQQEQIHKSNAYQKIVRGGWRAGKTLTCAVEFARAITGSDPYGKYPTDRPLTAWILTWDESNIGRTIHSLLFRAGAFWMIRDEITGEWREWREYESADKAREKERKPAPPLIPPRMIADWSWKEKSKRTFAVCRLVNGTEIYCFSSGGDPPTGDPCDLIWIDEDLQYGEHLHELHARLIDRNGRLLWSAKPRSRNDALMGLSKIAEEQKSWAQPAVAEFALAMSANPHLPEEGKRQAIAKWTPSQRRLFDYGEFLTDSFLIYPSFHIDTHGIPNAIDGDGNPLPAQFWDIDQVIIDNRGQIPLDWTRYMVVDPGHTVCAVLFAAVPPPYLGDHVVFYDELYLEGCDPPCFGRNVAAKAAGNVFWAFIIDDHGSRVRLASSHGSKTVRQQYSDQLRIYNVESQTTGHSFQPGSDDVDGRQQLLRTWLAVRSDGTTRFRILRDHCPMFRHEIERFKKRIIQGVIMDDPGRQRHHAVDCAEYLAASYGGQGPRYHPMESGGRAPSKAYLDFQQLMKEIKGRDGAPAFHLGPGKN